MNSPFLIGIIALVVGLGGGYVFRKFQIDKYNQEAIERTRKKVEEEERRAKDIVLEAKNEALRLREDAQKEESKKRNQLEETAERLMRKEESLDAKIENNEKLKVDLEARADQVKKLKSEIQEIYDMQQKQLESISDLNKEQAKEFLFKKLEEEYQEEILHRLEAVEKLEKEKAKDKARWILADTIQRYAAEVASESTATSVDLPSDELKGRIIGKEGRNIHSFEESTGVDVIIDDTPGSIVLSGFDLMRRYIAKVSLERLLVDGRIHPARIEETVQKVKGEVNELIKELGEKAAFEVGVAGLSPNLVKLLGRLKFRTSHGQNVLKHSMEVAFLAAGLASQLGANVEMCKKAGLLHDIGKAVDHEISGSTAQIGRDILKKFGLSKEVTHIVEASDGSVEPNSLEAMIVEAANKIAETRPGAQKDNLDNFIRRLDEMENVVKNFEAVNHVYAVHAGNELRVFVNPDKVDDLGMKRLANDIAKTIENDLQYPGFVKVNLMREVRGEAFAE
jgi:ribonucrease Y